MLPLVRRLAHPAWRPQRVGGQFARGALHTVGLSLWFLALPRIPLADMTAIGFTTPIVVMLASAPVFAASFLLTKSLTRDESALTILLWQSISVSLFGLPLALPGWQALSPAQWLGFLACGLLGRLGHYGLTRSFAATDISATQSAKFLDLVWAALLGWLVFGDVPTGNAIAGGLVIAAATLWVARREGRIAREATECSA